MPLRPAQQCDLARGSHERERSSPQGGTHL